MHEEGRASEHVSDNEDADDENEQQEESQQLLPFAAKLEPSSTSIDITGSEQLSLQEQRNQQQILANAIYPPSEIENALLAYQHQSNYQQQQQQHMQHLGMEFETMKHMNSNQLRFVPTPPFTPPPPPPHLQEHDWMMTGNHFYST